MKWLSEYIQGIIISLILLVQYCSIKNGLKWCINVYSEPLIAMRRNAVMVVNPSNLCLPLDSAIKTS